MFKIPINQFIEIRFGSLPISIGGALFGPGVAAAIGALSDIGGYLVKPTGPFFPGFTISGLISGLIFGFFFYKKTLTWTRILAAEVVNTVVVNLLLNTYWLMTLYGTTTYMPLLISRLPKEIILTPVMTVIMVAVMKAMEQFGLRAAVAEKAH